MILGGDVGGLGAGSKFSYSATAIAEWRFQRNVSLMGGYKILGFDYERGDTAYDLRMQGPISTLAFKFEF